ncbi:MAG: M42 family peptidase [Ruminococcus sp.]|nr:M42 family peptidase [Ruminococcus sp.]
MLDYNLLKRLCDAFGISGDEENIRNIIINEIKPFADEITIDNLGNLIVYKKGQQRPKHKLMLSAHMDEVGFMVTDITSDGYIKFDEVGGIDRRVVPGKQVIIGKNCINGVVGLKPIHLSKGDEATAIPKFSDMYIDIGAESKEDALAVVNFGDSINFVTEFSKNDFTINAKALDDRFGCYVLIEMIKSKLEYDMYFAFVVQEEVGLRGAKTAAYSIDPEFALVIETTTAADIPENDKAKQVCALGEGAVISVMDRRTIYDKQLVKSAFDCADKLNIKAQYKKAIAGGNDAGAIHQSRCGVRTLAISLPSRYLHAPDCVVNIADCESMLSLVPAMADNIASGKIDLKGTV